MFRTVPLSIIRSFSLYTHQWYMSYRFTDILRAGSGRSSFLILLASCVLWKTPDDGQRNCPKHVEFYSKNKFEKLVHSFVSIIRIYHHARSPERQIDPVTVTLIISPTLWHPMDIRGFLLYFCNGNTSDVTPKRYIWILIPSAFYITVIIKSCSYPFSFSLIFFIL